MAEFALLDAQVGAVAAGGRRLAGDAFDNLNAGADESVNFFRVVGEQADTAQAEETQGVGGQGVGAAVGGEAQPAVGFHGVEAAVLQLVGAQLIHQADAPALLGLIEQHTGAGASDAAQGQFELGAAVAALRRKSIARQALGVNPYQGRPPAVQIAFHEGNQRIVAGVLETKNAEIAEAGGETSFGNFA